MNVIERLRFELAYNNVTVHLINHDTMKTTYEEVQSTNLLILLPCKHRPRTIVSVWVSSMGQADLSKIYILILVFSLLSLLGHFPYRLSSHINVMNKKFLQWIYSLLIQYLSTDQILWSYFPDSSKKYHLNFFLPFSWNHQI